MLQDLWSSAVQQVVLFIAQILLVGFLVWIHRLVPLLHKWVKQHLSIKERMFLEQVGKEAYRFAEAAYRNAGGPAKLTQALNYATAVANRQGLHLTSAELRASIEQAVWMAKQQEQGANEVNTEKQP